MVPSYALRRTQMRALPYTISLMSSCNTPATAAVGLLPLRLRWRSQCCAAAPNANPNPETHMVTPTPGPRAPDSNSTRIAGIEHRAHPEPNTHPIPAPSLTNLVHARTHATLTRDITRRCHPNKPNPPWRSLPHREPHKAAVPDLHVAHPDPSCLATASLL
jgi:hypothetical protein